MTQRTVLVATAKDEGPYIWEWVAYHKAVGFDDIIIFQNDSTDGTHEILSALQDCGEIQYLYNRAPVGKHQIQAYRRSARQPGFQASDWAIALDLDEFFVVKTGAGTLADFMPRAEQSDCVFVNWKSFGSSGATALSDELVTDRFRLAEHSHWIEKHPRAFKSLYRSKLFGRPGIHKPPTLELHHEDTRIINGSGLSHQDFIIRNFQSTDQNRQHFAQINHYIVRDAQSFVLKNLRGSAHQSNRDISRKYWKKRNKNQVQDNSIGRIRPRLYTELKRLDQKTEGQLSALTRDARRYHSERFAQAIQSDEGVALYQFCIANPNLGREVSPQRLY